MQFRENKYKKKVTENAEIVSDAAQKIDLQGPLTGNMTPSSGICYLSLVLMSDEC
jgi:hypothetical protein